LTINTSRREDFPQTPETRLWVLTGPTHRCDAGRLIVADVCTNRQAEIEDEAEVLDVIEMVLQKFQNPSAVDSIVNLYGGFESQVTDALQALRSSGFLIPRAEFTRRILNTCRTANSNPGYDEAAVYGFSRWQPPGIVTTTFKGIRSNSSERGRSIPLDIDGRSAEPVQLSDVTALLDQSYGTLLTGYKPVPSAGALWPLVFYVWAPSELNHECHLHWFDDEGLNLFPMHKVRTSQTIGSWFLQPEYVETLLNQGAVLILICADLARIEAKYGNRAVFFTAIETGAVMQEICRRAPSRGLVARPIGGFHPANPPGDIESDLEFMLTVALWKPGE
jgi:hypothetical protein